MTIRVPVPLRHPVLLNLRVSMNVRKQILLNSTKLFVKSCVAL